MPKTDGITQKQEAAVQAFIENGGNRCAAYRSSYNAKNMKQSTVEREACVLFKSPMVTARIKELQAEHLLRHNVTVDTISVQLEQDRNFAYAMEVPGAATTATMALAKIHGLVRDKVDHTVRTIQPVIRK